MPLDPTYTVATNAADSRIRTFLLLECDFPSGTVNWTNCDQPIVTGSPARSDCAPAATWTPKPFRTSGITSEQGMRAGATIEVGNADNTLSAILFGATNPTGVPIFMWEAWFDPRLTSAMPDDSTQLVSARLSQLRMKTSAGVATATLVLAPPVDFAARTLPRRRMTQKCPFVFKSAACQSNGSDTVCDGTFTACSMTTKRSGGPTGGNRDNFGGFQMLPAMGI